MENEKALTIVEERDIIIYEPQKILEQAHRAAKALTDVIKQKKKPVIINNEQYLEFEDWQTVGQFFGYTVKTLDAQEILIGDSIGAKAKAIVLDKEGREVGGAEAYCMRDEANWKNKPWFQLASMAQTRAGSKALRNRLAWVVVLAGYRPTPAEEMEGINIPKGKLREDIDKEDMEVFKKESEKKFIEAHDRITKIENLFELKNHWKKHYHEYKDELLPEHFTMLEQLKDKMKGKFDEKT